MPEYVPVQCYCTYFLICSTRTTCLPASQVASPTVCPTHKLPISICPAFCYMSSLHLHFPACQSVPACQPANLPACLPASQPAIQLADYLPTVPAYLQASNSNFLPDSLSRCLSACLSTCPPAYLPNSLPASQYLRDWPTCQPSCLPASQPAS